MKIAKANTMADILEIRLDLMDTFDLPRLIQAAAKPVLVTYRSDRQGGRGRADPETHTEHVLDAIENGAHLVDVELGLPRKWREKIFEVRGKSRIVLSTHVNDETPSRGDLTRILKQSVATSAEIVKIVTRAKTWEDNLRVLELIPRGQDLGIEITAFCMGPVGRISRVLSHLMGGCLTFASLEEGEESGDGQIPIKEMKKIVEQFAA